MFGLIGAAIFGIVSTGAWIKDEQSEQSRRKNAREDHCEFYIDKNGRFRHTNNGRKYTTEEIHQAFFNDEEAKRRREYYESKYWVVRNLLDYDMNNYVIEVFLTKEEAECFANRIKNIMMGMDERTQIKIRYISVGAMSQASIDGLKDDICWDHEFHNNF